MLDRKYMATIIDRETERELEPNQVPVTYHPDKHRIGLVNLFTGKAIPEDEPTFIVRAKDEIAIEVVAHYHSRLAIYGGNKSVFTTVNQCEQDMLAWRRNNPGLVKKPD